ncbi:MAG: phosphotransferase [Deltaproteobacteria bacterium]|nr:phosphotransferase [Deltaproteobacteria bacterium]MBW2416240.1 phosphotransferase [Deltaproteobacteria bacterium]
MDSPSRVVEADAREFLEAHLGRPVEDVSLVGEGAWSRCFGFRDRGDDRVVRFGRFVDDFENDRLASNFASPGLPVPRLLEIGRAFDAWFAISERVFGEPLETLPAEGWQAVVPSLFAALDAMRTTDLSGSRGYGGWDATGDAPQREWREFLLAVDRDAPDRRTHGWRSRLREAAGGDAMFRAGYAKLAARVDAVPSDRHLVHGDLINRNVVVHDDAISGVFDWGCSLYGDFLYDLAWLEFWSPWHPGMARLDLCARAREHYAAIGLDVPDLDARLRVCMLHIGLDHLAYNAWAQQPDALAEVTEAMRPLLDD